MMHEAPDHTNFVERYREAGYLLRESMLSESRLLAIEAEIDRIARWDPSEFQPRDLFFTEGTDVVQQIEHLERYSSLFAELHEDRHIRELVESLLPMPIRCENVSYMAKPAQIGAVVPYHQDNAYYHFVPADALTVWVALDPSRIANGCLRVIPRSHEKGTVDHVPSGVHGISVTVAEPIDPVADGEVAVELRRGGASVHHCNLFHASHPNCSHNNRRGLVLFYHSVHCKVDERLREIYLNAQEQP